MTVHPKPARNDRQPGIESIETGMKLLSAFITLRGRSQQLKVLAEAAGMPPSKAHRYLVSLIRMGFVERDGINGHYRLGPRSIELGAAALDAVDAVALTVESMIALHDELDHTMALSVWGSQAPVIVRVEEAEQLMTVGFRVGKPLPLLGSAAGLLFSAFLPRGSMEPLFRAEIAANRKRRSGIMSLADAERLLDEVRARGLSRIAGDITPGINALGAPIFDQRGYPAVVISAVGPAGHFDMRWTGSVATALQRHASQLSRRLGYAGPLRGGEHLTEQPAGTRADAGARPRGRAAQE